MYVAVTSDDDNKADGIFEQPAEKIRYTRKEMADDISRLKIEKPAGRSDFRRRSRRFQLWAAAAALLALAVFLARGALTAPEVRVGEAALTYPSQGLTVLNASGYVVAERRAALASKITGRLVWLGVEEGSRVEKGQVVARLENADLEATLDQASASLKAAGDNLDAARAEYEDSMQDFERKRGLLEGGFVSRSVFDMAEARFKKASAAFAAAQAQINSARAALRGARASLGYSEIRAPFTGVVLTKNADIGDIVTPLGASAGAKAAVVTIADMDTLQVEADVSEANISRVFKGMPCEIQLDALPLERFDGFIHMIVPTADRTKASVMVKIRFSDKDRRILPEMSAKVSFLSRAIAPDEEEPRTTVPASAVTGDNGRKFIFTVEDNRAKKVQVSTGVQIGDAMEVKGVEPGSRVIIAPPEGLDDGSKIKVQEE